MNANKLILCIFVAYLIYKIFSDMSWIQDVKDLSISTKSILLSLIPITLLWFIIEYLYFPLIITYTWYVILAFCFLPAIFWYGLQFLFMYFLATKTKLDFKEISTDIKLWIALGADASIYLVLVALFPIILKVPFEYFLLVIFGYKVLCFFLIKPISNNILRKVKAKQVSQ